MGAYVAMFQRLRVCPRRKFRSYGCSKKDESLRHPKKESDQKPDRFNIQCPECHRFNFFFFFLGF